MKKRILSVLAAACLCLMCVTGCSETSSEKDDSKALSQAEQTSQTSETSQETTTQNTTTTQTSSESQTTTTTEETTTTTSAETTEQTTTTSASSQQAQPPVPTQRTTANTTAAKPTETTKAQTTASKVKRVKGTSPNISFYQSRLVVAGDSVAAGYNAYGYIPDNHNLAIKNVSVTSYRNYTFNATGQWLGIVESIEKMKPSLILTSMGANDCLISPSLYGQRYRDYLKRLRAASPDSIILVGALTPTALKTNYPHVTINIVRSFNAQLKALAESMDNKVIYFDAFSVVVEDNGVYMDPNFAAFDGFHLQAKAYEELLRVMAVTLDSHGAKEKITARENG